MCGLVGRAPDCAGSRGIPLNRDNGLAMPEAARLYLHPGPTCGPGVRVPPGAHLPRATQT